MSKSRSGSRFPTRGVPWAAALACLALTALAGWTSARAADACAIGSRADAARNAVTLTTLAWAPFGRPEAGWTIYAPLVASEIATRCPPTSPGFAAALARWRRAHGLGGPGVVDEPTFAALKLVWYARRPFVAASKIACPPPPPEASLAQARKDEGWSGKAVWLRPAALDAYRRMVAAARAEAPEVAADHQLMTIFSAYRSPPADADRCLREGNCQGVARAACSAHRTALAVDLFLGAAPGIRPDSSDDLNRLFVSRTGAYRWLVANARRFGFVNYPFEPWHWEWTGAAP